MGTSSSYGGPVGRNPLLPPWAVDFPMPNDTEQETSSQDNENNGEQAQEGQPQPPQPLNPSVVVAPDVSWRGTKGIISKMANGGSPSWNSAFRSYVRARGGAQTAARSSISGKATTVRLGAFLADVINNGATQAIRNLGLIDYIGRDAQTLLAAFIDLIAPPGSLLEEAIARKASIETVSELFERYEVAEGGISALDSIDIAGMKEIITLSVSNYINERFEQELVNCIERGSISEEEANQLSEQAKGFIEGVVAIDVEDIDIVMFDWNGSEGKSFIDELYQIAYSLLGDKK